MERPIILLTFDIEHDYGREGDRAIHEYLPKVLDLLQAQRIQATFFTSSCLLTNSASHAPLRTILKGGHEMASHGHTHRRYRPLSDIELINELSTSKDQLESFSGVPIHGIRPPYFSNHVNQNEIAHALGYRYLSTSASLYPSVLNLFDRVVIKRELAELPVSKNCFLFPYSLSYLSQCRLPHIVQKNNAYTMINIHLHDFLKPHRLYLTLRADPWAIFTDIITRTSVEYMSCTSFLEKATRT